MAEYLSIAEVSRLTGLAPHTIRFYESQFPNFLTVERSPGGHRQYRSCHVEALQSIIQLVRHDRLSIREAQARLGEPIAPVLSRANANSEDLHGEGLQQILGTVLEKLDELSRHNVHIDSLLDALLHKT